MIIVFPFCRTHPYHHAFQLFLIATEKSGLKSGDKILEINNRSINDFNDIGTILNVYKYKNFEFKIQRNEYKLINLTTLYIISSHCMM